MWVEKSLNCINTSFSLSSSSLWGCELKKYLETHPSRTISHPPCEDVSWKIIIPASIALAYRHPPCEDVSWQTFSAFHSSCNRCHPPCEDVSWKPFDIYVWQLQIVILLVRMWVEKLLFLTEFSAEHVILLVRMWVEKQACFQPSHSVHRHPPWEDESWKTVCIYSLSSASTSSSLRGCELKRCWNNPSGINIQSSSLRGWELKKWRKDKNRKKRSHPPWEDESWKENDVKMYGTQV